MAARIESKNEILAGEDGAEGGGVEEGKVRERWMTVVDE